MSQPKDVEAFVRLIAQTAVYNEKYFSELDGVVGDGDFGTRCSPSSMYPWPAMWSTVFFRLDYPGRTARRTCETA